MKFTVLAVLPALLWTGCILYAVDMPPATDADMGALITLFLAWSITAAVVALYWAVRIIRFALHRGDWSSDGYVPPPWQR